MYLSNSFFSTDQSYEDRDDTWNNGLPKSFGFLRKFKKFAREMLNFLGFLFVWVGAWDFLDNNIWPDSPLRDLLYIIIPMPIAFFLEEVLAAESLYYVAVKLKQKETEKELKPTSLKLVQWRVGWEVYIMGGKQNVDEFFCYLLSCNSFWMEEQYSVPNFCNKSKFPSSKLCTVLGL